MLNRYELIPQFDSRKSFYHKATVEIAGDKKTLVSYVTPVVQIIGEQVDFLNMHLWSVTTRRHIREFLKQNEHEEMIAEM